MNLDIGNTIHECTSKDKIFIEEPYLGGGIFEKDTGLCNRLFNWEVCEQINKKNNHNFQLLVKDIYWPEKDFIDIPNLQFIETTLFNFYKSDDISKSHNINKNLLRKMIISNNYKLTKGHDYRVLFGYNYIWDIYKNSYELLDRPIKSISLKNKNIQKIISRKMWNVVGFHIRWGYGVNKSRDQLNFVKKYSCDIPEIEKNSNNKLYEFISEDKYINFIKRILKYRPNQIFYLSSDLGKESIDNIKGEFYNNIITYENILEEIIEYFIHTEKKTFELNYQTIINVIDLFSLAHCGVFYRHPRSTWSDFVQIYRDIPTFDITQDYESLFKHYYTYSNWW